MKKHRTHLIILILWPLIAVVISFAFFNPAPPIGQFVGTLLFLGVPSLMLAFWAPQNIIKATIFGLVFVPLWFLFEYVMHTNGQWFTLVISNDNRFLGGIAWEAPPWYFLIQFYIIMFWEHFFEHHKHVKIWQRRMARLTISSLVFLLITAVMYIWAPSLLKIPYFYLIMLLSVFVIPLTLELRAYPEFILRFLKVGAYFAYAFLLYEVTAIATGLWWFPGEEFVGWVTILGSKFPFEEFVAWILIGSVTCISWYEYFDDDER